MPQGNSSAANAGPAPNAAHAANSAAMSVIRRKFIVIGQHPLRGLGGCLFDPVAECGERGGQDGEQRDECFPKDALLAQLHAEPLREIRLGGVDHAQPYMGGGLGHEVFPALEGEALPAPGNVDGEHGV